jgi:endonuclease YncB( thermonuclease family)
MGCTSSINKPIFDDIKNLSNKEKYIIKSNDLNNSNELNEPNEPNEPNDLAKILDESVLKMKNKKYKLDSNFDYKLIKKFNLEGIIGEFYVKSVYDGDTITVYIPMKISIYSNVSVNFIDSNNLNDKTICNYEIRLRLFGIDTPELKPGKNIPNREEHIKKAHEAKEFLENLILNKIVQIEFLTNDKYGRPLGIIYFNNININKLMVEQGLAKEYDGGTKDSVF